MIQVRKADTRGHAEHGGWLDSWHTFSFANYYDPAHMGYSVLRVINDDVIAPGAGFPMHAHQDMEIVTYVLEGALEHRDSLGNGDFIRPGDVQRMSAGTGVQHSEFNPSSAAPVHFLQIWLEPEQGGMAPSYEQKFFGHADKRGRLRLIASHDGRDGSVTVHQDADVYASLLNSGEQVSHALAAGRLGYVHLVSGSIRVNGIALKTGDAAKIEAEQELVIAADEDSELLLFDLG